jgi:peptidoglycan/xylan/chitin deacetylase (PgdA/CDA1 family)
MTRHPLWAALRRRLRPVKRVVVGPGALALDALARCSARRWGVVIVYHRVGDPPGDPHTQLVPALASGLFRAQLALLRRRYTIVPAPELLAAASARRRFQRFPVALTFDDDWSGHVRVSMGLLAEAGVAATFFLNGSSLERPRRLWFEVLQEAYDRGALGPPAAIHAEAARIQALAPEQRRATIAQLCERLRGTQDADADPGLRAEDVRLLASAGHEIAFHTREHETLTTLADAELERALRDGRSELEAAAGAPLNAIAYPAGRADARVVERARAAGFSRGYSTVAQAVAPQSDPLHLGRVYPSSESTARLHLAIGRALAARRRDGATTEKKPGPRGARWYRQTLYRQ